MAWIFLIRTNLVRIKSVYTCGVKRNKCELKFNPTSNPRINLIRIKPSKRTKLVRLCDLIRTKSEKIVCVNGAILDLDGVALSNAAHIIAPSLQIIFNKSLELGHVPDDWKLPRVTPLYKGIGSKDDRSNYKPISVISHIPKIIEKFVSFMLNKYLCENSLLKNDQFSYVNYQSTVNALHTVVDIALKLH